PPPPHGPMHMRVGHLKPWLYAAPMLLAVAAVYFYPMVQLVRYSVESVSPSPYIPSRFVGLDNFRFVWSDTTFRGAIGNNVKLFLAVPILVALSVLISAILFDRKRGWRFYRTMIFLPYVLSIPVVGVVFGYVFQDNGIVNSTLRNVGLGGVAQDWLGTPQWALWTIMAVIVWKELGFGVILCLARLMSVDEHLFEAARVDGARWWRVLWHVTLPQLGPAIAFYAVVELITMLSWVFAYVYVMTSGGPENSTVVSEYYIYQAVFQNNVIGVGAAAGVMLLAVVSVFIVVRLWVAMRFEVSGYES
ncbi:MAG TPA: sugar ABC transporter permease, partial [Gaiellales bacterium]|nr:sugar ABC transporter permease [Gaiellales bacterium]